MYNKLKEYYSNGLSIQGLNLGQIDNAKFNKLSEFNEVKTFSPEQIDIITRFEKRFEELYERAQKGSQEETTITPLPIKEGKVNLQNGMVFHTCRADINVLSNISKGGVLASEWFGQKESEGEAYMCAFASQVRITDNPTLNSILKQRRNPTFNKCNLFFDEKNPLMQELLKIDFFKYEQIKQKSPELLPKLYSQGIIDLYDKIIEPNSPHGKNMKNDPQIEQYDWLAIPGGIPPMLVNGVNLLSQSKNLGKNELMNHLDEIQKMFPNATIFDKDNSVLRYPLNQHKEINVINEK